MKHDPLAALQHPPRVNAIDGDVVVTGDYVCACYTPAAAREKAALLLKAADQADRQNTGSTAAWWGSVGDRTWH